MQHKKEAYWFYRFISIFYDDLINPLFWTVPMREEALSIAGLDDEEGLTVIDVGSGTGFATEGIVEYVKPTQVTCIDQSPHQMQHARAKESLHGAKFHIGDAENLPVTTNSYDRYVSAGSIEFWPHPAQGVREAFRVVKPGGRATIVGPLEPKTSLGRLLANTAMLFPPKKDYIDWFTKAGFEDIQVTYLSPSWYTRDDQFALSISGRKPIDGPKESPKIPEPKDIEGEGLFASAKTAGRVALGAAAGGAFIPVALGGKAIAVLNGEDDEREPLTNAQKSVLTGVGVAAAVGLIAMLTRKQR